MTHVHVNISTSIFPNTLRRSKSTFCNTKSKSHPNFVLPCTTIPNCLGINKQEKCGFCRMILPVQRFQDKSFLECQIEIFRKCHLAMFFTGFQNAWKRGNIINMFLRDDSAGKAFWGTVWHIWGSKVKSLSMTPEKAKTMKHHKQLFRWIIPQKQHFEGQLHHFWGPKMKSPQSDVFFFFLLSSHLTTQTKSNIADMLFLQNDSAKICFLRLDSSFWR